MVDLFDGTWQEVWGAAGRHDSVGAVFTRPEVVDLILDLAGYVPEGQRLAESPVLEPSCGDGAFLSSVVRRLVLSERQHVGKVDWDDPVLEAALTAADISPAAVRSARHLLVRELTSAGCPADRARELARAWVLHTDFLLHPWDRRFDFVVGNPPYVRIEEVPRRVLARYRALYPAAGDRSDLYVAFLEQGLQLLSGAGTLAFITANRFAKNHYGRGIRKLIATRYRVRFYLNLEHTQPFRDEVSAYPAILVVDRKRGAPTRAATLEGLAPDQLAHVRRHALSPAEPGGAVSQFPEWYPDGGPWVSTSRTEQRALAAVRSTFPTLEESAPGTVVGIGVATGADRVFILPEKDPRIEEDRQMPLVMAADVRTGEVAWSGRYLLNPFAPGEEGGLVDLSRYPGLDGYLASHADRLTRRHVAKSRPHAWYRTIDRIWPALQKKAKLLIPDIQSAASVAVGLDAGRYYPHHNLYWITSEGWDLRVLGALLRSSRVLEQVRAYSVQMRGGSLRWQAQTLRRLRVPAVASLPDPLLGRLAAVSAATTTEEIDALADEAYAAA